MILIDADILVYRAISSVEHEIEWEEDLWVMFSDEGDAREAFDEMLSNILSAINQKRNYMLCFSDRENFRKDIDPTYKMNRANTRKPLGFKSFRQHVMDTYPSYLLPRLEADDCLGILGTKNFNQQPILVSADKDLMQIPGLHLVDGNLVTVTKEEGDYLHLKQTLTGDTVDGYSGCPGIGPVKADKILSEGATWANVVKAYEKAGLTEADALRQARLARILQAEDWDANTQRPILWSPK